MLRQPGKQGLPKHPVSPKRVLQVLLRLVQSSKMTILIMTCSKSAKWLFLITTCSKSAKWLFLIMT